MSYDEQLAARIRALLKRRKSIVEKRMFGGVGFLLQGNMCVGIWKDALIARIGPLAYKSALAEPHVREFDITGRPMRGWVMVDPAGVADDDVLDEWIERAIGFVNKLPAK